MWDFIINPMVTLLTLMYSLLGNSVILAIVVLTIIIRLLMYPMLAQQQETAKKTADVQPKLKKLQEKYKDDKEKLAQAQMELYREAGINPLSGCLPLLLQFPIFIALYQAIYFALASSPFQLVDLAQRLLIPGLDRLIPLQNVWLGMRLTEPPSPPINPVYALVMPLLVMVTTYLQFKMSAAQTTPPDTGDGQPNQAAQMTQSMGTIMPLMFGFIALSMSVGLSIYFITSNIAGMIQYSSVGKKVLDIIFRSGTKETTPVVDTENLAVTPPKSSRKNK